MPELSFGEVGEILQLLQAVDGTEIDLEWGDLRIQVRRGGEASPVVSVSGTAQAGMAGTQSGSGATPWPAAEPVVSPPAVSAEPARTVPTEAGSHSTSEIPAHWVAVTAPMAGTFYRSPTPNDPPFAEVGDTVSEGQTVALIEVMKLFTELKSEVSGKVTRADVPDSTLVEYGQAVVWIEPA